MAFLLTNCTSTSTSLQQSDSTDSPQTFSAHLALSPRGSSSHNTLFTPIAAPVVFPRPRHRSAFETESVAATVFRDRGLPPPQQVSDKRALRAGIQGTNARDVALQNVALDRAVEVDSNDTIIGDEPGREEDNPPSVRTNLATWLQERGCGFSGWTVGFGLFAL